MRKLGKRLSQVERSVEAYAYNCYCACNYPCSCGSSATASSIVYSGYSSTYSASANANLKQY